MTDTGKAMGREATLKAADLTLDEALALANTYERIRYSDPRRISWAAAYESALTLIDEQAKAAVARAIDRRLAATQEPKP